MPIEKSSKIWMNGELVDWDDATIHVLTHTLHYGNGVFEGIRHTQSKGKLELDLLEKHWILNHQLLQQFQQFHVQELQDILHPYL